MPDEMPRASAWTYAGVIATTFFWGSNFLVGAHLLHQVSALGITLERFVISTALLLVIFGGSGRLRLQTLRRNFAALTAVGLFGGAGFNLLMYTGLESTSAINAALIMATTPLWTPLIATLLGEERIDRRGATGLAFGLVGVILVISHGRLQALLGLQFSTGDLMVLGGALCWSMATALSRRKIKEATAQETTAYSMLISTVVLIVLGFIYERPISAIAATPIDAHLSILYLAVCGTVLAYLFWFDAVLKIGAGRTASFFNLVPVFTVLIALALGTPPSVWQWIGMAGVILGVMLASGAPQHKAATA